MEVFGKIVEALKSLKIEPKNIIGFVDASFKYKLKDLLMYQKYIEQGLILMTPAGVKADKYILSFCIKHPNSLMITNDLMREYDSSLPSYKWIKEKRVTVLIVRDELFLIPMLDYYQEKESDISSSENQNQFPILDRIFAQKGELNLYGEV